MYRPRYLAYQRRRQKPLIIDIRDESMEFKIKSQVGSMDEDIMCIKEGKDLLIGFNPEVFDRGAPSDRR